MRQTPVKLVHKRNVVFNCILSICTIIYQFFWLFELDKETKAITKNNNSTSSCKVVIFSIFTLGIYMFYWVNKNATRQANYFNLSNNYAKKCLLISIIGEIIALLLFSTITYVANIYPSDELTILTSLTTLILPVPFIIVFSIMQNTNNKILDRDFAQRRTHIYVKNSDILNRLFWGAAFLFTVAEVIISFGSKFGQDIVNLIEPDSVQEITDLSDTQALLQYSVDQVNNANNIQQLIPNTLGIIASFVVLFWFMFWFRHNKFKGIIGLTNIGKSFLYSIPALILPLVNLLGCLSEGGINFNIGIILLGFLPGISEEVAFRGLLIPNWMRLNNNKLGIYLSLWGTSIFFGLVHATNIFMGADPGTTIFQVVYTTAIGVLLSSIFIRSGNFWPLIIAHSAIDIIAFMAPSALEQGAVQTQAFVFDASTIFLLILCAGMIAYGMFLCRKKKHNEIIDVWRKKFVY